MSELVRSLLLSLLVAVCAVCMVTLVAVPMAFILTRTRSAFHRAIEVFLTVPLVLPPTVVGYYLIVVLGRRGWLGQYLDRWFGYSIMFNWHGAVLAAAVVCFPLVYLPARSAFASVDQELEDMARLLGAGSLRMFWHVSLPMAAKGIAAGMILGFTRALGEFGATIMVMGDTTRYRTLPLMVYADYSSTDGMHGVDIAAILLTILSIACMLMYHRSSFGRQT